MTRLEKLRLYGQNNWRAFGRLMLALDMQVNALRGGDPDETLSSWFAKAADDGLWWGRLACWVLNLFQRCHCKKALDRQQGSDAIFPDPPTSPGE